MNLERPPLQNKVPPQGGVYNLAEPIGLADVNHSCPVLARIKPFLATISPPTP